MKLLRSLSLFFVSVFSAHQFYCAYGQNEITEDFENGVLNTTPGAQIAEWTTSEDCPWFVSNADPITGSYSIRSGVVDHYMQQTELQLEVYCKTGQISFKIKSGNDAEEHLFRFEIDDHWVFQGNPASEEIPGPYSRDDYVEYTFNVSEGIHRFEWTFMNYWNVVESWEPHCVWIDDIKVPIGSQAGEDQHLTTEFGGQSTSTRLDGSGTTYFSGTVNSYEWEWEDAQGTRHAFGVNPLVEFSGGYNNVTLTTTTDEGVVSTDTTLIRVDQTRTNQFTHQNQEAGDRFGHSVDIYENIAALGAKGKDTGGAVYLFDVSDPETRVQLAKIDAPGFNVLFGNSVAIYDDLLVVGASKAALLFDISDPSNPIELCTLLPSDNPDVSFGELVAIYGDRVLVSSDASVYLFDISDRELPRLINELVSDEPEPVIFSSRMVSEYHAQTDEWIQVEEQVPHTVNFGKAIAIHDQTFLIGSSGARNNVSGKVSGAVYIYDATDGSLLSKLVPSDGEDGDGFGASVAINGNSILVGAKYKDHKGYVYVYDETGRNQLARFESGDYSVTSKHFGSQIDLYGNNVIIAQPTTNQILLYNINDRRNPEPVVRLNPDEFDASDYPGIFSMAVGEHLVIIGETTYNTNSGIASIYEVDAPTSVYTVKFDEKSQGFVYDMYELTQFIEHGQAAQEPNVVVDDGWVLSGWDRDFSNITASVTINALYQRDDDGDGIPNGIDTDNDSDGIDDDWEMEAYGDLDTADGSSDYDGDGISDLEEFQNGSDPRIDETRLINYRRKLLANDGADGDFFGDAVAVQGDIALIGVYQENDNGLHAGSAYLFNLVTGEQISKFQPSHVSAEDNFGASVAINGDYAIIGAPKKNTTAFDAGIVYVFDISDPSNPQELRTFTPSDEGPYTQFGSSVSIDGTLAVIGAPHDDDRGDLSGSAYLFHVPSGLQIAKLSANDGSPNDRFGSSVSINGDYAIVGSPYDNNLTGSVYLFDAHTGKQLNKFTASDGHSADQFGSSIDLKNTIAAIGATNGDGAASDSGCVYLFDVESGNQLKKLFPLSGKSDDNFGAAVSLNRDWVVVGARRQDYGGMDAGSAYVFNRYSGQHLYTLLAFDTERGDEFGDSVSIHQNIVLVGARMEDERGVDAGCAYVFDFDTDRDGMRDSWEEQHWGDLDTADANTDADGDGISDAEEYQQDSDPNTDERQVQTNFSKLLAADGAGGDEFGYAVAVKNNVALVGSHQGDAMGEDSGAAYLYHASSHQQFSKLLPIDGGAGDHFGCAVDMEGGLAIVGACMDDISSFGTDSGSAYVFDVSNPFQPVQLFKLMPADGMGSAFFGYSVAINGDIALVGAHNDLNSGAGMHDGQGSLYVFDLNTGAQIYKFQSHDAVQSDFFGYAIDLEGSKALISAVHANGANLNHSGVAYLYDFTVPVNPLFLSKLHADDGAEDDRFGCSVSLHENLAMVGACLTDENEENSGSVYVFDLENYQQVVKLTARNAQEEDRFGISVDADNGVAVIGAWKARNDGARSGSSFLFDLHSFTELGKLQASDSAEGDHYGHSVSIDFNTVVVGAYGDDDLGEDSGSAYVFNIDEDYDGMPDLWENEQFGDSSQADAASDRDGDGITDVDEFSAGSDPHFFNVPLTNPTHKLLANDGESSDVFGYSVAVSDTHAVLGAYAEDELGDGAGAAYLFDPETGNQIRKITASDGAVGDQFGRAIAMDSRTVIVGAPEDNTNGFESGSAYLFDVYFSDQETKLTPDDGADWDFFGWSVDVSNGIAIVGAYNDGNSGVQFNYDGYGSAYLFDVETGEQIAKLIPDRTDPYFMFGWSVAIDGDYALVGARGDYENGDGSGSVYVFDVSSGEKIGKLIPEDGAPGHQFGYAVDVFGNYAVVGAYGHNENGTNSGCVYLFNLVTGEQIYKIQPIDSNENDQFGAAVSMNDTGILVGAKWDDDGGSKSGSAYIFDLLTGKQLTKLIAPDGVEDDEFGYAVSMSHGNFLVGSYHDDDKGFNSGSGYLFNVDISAQFYSVTFELGDHGAVDDPNTLSQSIQHGRSAFEPEVTVDANWVLSGWSTNFDVVTSSVTVTAEYEPDDDGDGIGNSSDPDSDGDGIDDDWERTHFGNTTTANATSDNDSDRVSDLDEFLAGSDPTVRDFPNKILPDDGMAYYQFGISVSVSGELALIGSPNENDGNSYNSNAPGSAYLFDVSSPEKAVQLSKWYADDRTAGEDFGQAVAIEGNLALVGASDDDDSGRVLVFDVSNRASPVQIFELEPESQLAGDFFGSAVALSGNRAVIGANGEDINGASSGAAYVFDLSTGLQISKLVADDSVRNDYFGRAVDIDGGIAIVGAHSHDALGNLSGCAYLFDAESGRMLHKLLAEDGSASDYFGYSVAIKGNYAVVGAIGEADNGANSGAIYLFDVNSGEQLAKITANDGEAGDYFGWSLDISGYSILVGAAYDTHNGFSSSGSIYLYDLFTGNQKKKLSPVDSRASHLFGESVALAGNTMLIGARGDNDDGVSAGAAYSYAGGGNPNDVDEDYLIDSWELEYFGNLDQSGTDDPDEDSLDNFIEQAFGIDPSQGNPGFHEALVEFVRRDSNTQEAAALCTEEMVRNVRVGSLVLSPESEQIRMQFQLQWTDDLGDSETPADWRNMGDPLEKVEDLSDDIRFYRILVQE